MSLPFLTFIGAWLLLPGFDIAGVDGLVLPGMMGWVWLLIARIGALTTWLRRRSFRPPYVSPRAYAVTGAICAAVFLLLSSTELFISHWMPEA